MATKPSQNKPKPVTRPTTASPKGQTPKMLASTKNPPAGKKQQSLPTWAWIAGLLVVVWLGIALYLMLQTGSKGEQKLISIVNTADFHSLAFSPTNPDTVFFGSHNGLLKSNDGGRNWQPTSLKNQDAMSQGLAQNGKIIYIGGHDVLMKSEDSGQTWRSMLDKLPATDIHALTLDPASSNSLFAFAVGTGIIRSSDGGQSWQVISNKLGNGVTALVYGNKVLWVGVAGRGVLRSEDGGVTWQAASGFANGALNSSNQVTALAYDTTNGMLFAGTSDGLYQSMDGGASWNRLNYNGGIAALALNPANPKTLLVVNPKGEVFRSEDGGISWANK